MNSIINMREMKIFKEKECMTEKTKFNFMKHLPTNQPNRSRFALVFLLFMTLFLGSMQGWGQSIFTNPITGSNPNSDNPYTTGQTIAAGITVSGIGRGSGITGTNASDRYNAAGWNSVSFNANDYFEWTITPSSCREIDFTSFVYTSERSNS